MGMNSINVNQRPYYVNQNQIKKREDDEKSAAQTRREEDVNENSRSKGQQYAEEARQDNRPASKPMGYTPYTPAYSASTLSAQPVVQTPPSQAAGQQAGGKISPNINIAQVLKDFKNTAAAIGTPADLNEEVNGYLSLIEKQVTKDNPNTRLVKSNLKNASTILDKYISETLNKESKVVENWVDALFLQQIDFKYNENDVNAQFLVKFPEGVAKAEDKKAEETPQAQTPETPPAKPGIPQDKELKSAFIQAKKLAYADKPAAAIQAFQTALERAREVGDTDTESKIFFEVGQIYDDHDQFNRALISYNKAIEASQDTNVKTKAHFSMGQIYDDVNYVTPALDHYFNSISYGGEAENLVAQSTALAKVGNIYTDMFEEAFDYYSIAGDLAEQTDNSKIKGYVSSSLAGAYQRFGEPQEALRSYSNAVKHYNESNSPSKAAQNYLNAADIMLEFNNQEKARGLLKKAQVLAGKSSDEYLLNQVEAKLLQVKS